MTRSFATVIKTTTEIEMASAKIAISAHGENCPCACCSHMGHPCPCTNRLLQEQDYHDGAGPGTRRTGRHPRPGAPADPPKKSTRQSHHRQRVHGRRRRTKAANHLFRVARPDGLTIGNIGEGFVSSAVLGEGGVHTISISLFTSAPAVRRPIMFFIQGASWA